MTEYYRITMEAFERYGYKRKNEVQREKIAKKFKSGIKKREEKGKKKKQEQCILKHNAEIRKYAKECAEDMITNPSFLELKMIEFLDSHSIKYQFQKIFYIEGKHKKITHFYIADFYIPSKNLILETDGKFHDDQIEQDELRTQNIIKHYPNIKVIRWKFHDFNSVVKMRELLRQVA